jgi:hypothetical protein
MGNCRISAAFGKKTGHLLDFFMNLCHASRGAASGKIEGPVNFQQYEEKIPCGV